MAWGLPTLHTTLCSLFHCLRRATNTILASVAVVVTTISLSSVAMRMDQELRLWVMFADDAWTLDLRSAAAALSPEPVDSAWTLHTHLRSNRTFLCSVPGTFVWQVEEDILDVLESVTSNAMSGRAR